MIFAPKDSPARINSIAELDFGSTVFCGMRTLARRSAVGVVCGFRLGGEQKVLIRFNDGDKAWLALGWLQHV